MWGYNTPQGFLVLVDNQGETPVLIAPEVVGRDYVVSAASEQSAARVLQALSGAPAWVKAVANG